MNYFNHKNKGKTCTRCNKKNHFANVCRQPKEQNQVDSTDSKFSDSEDTFLKGALLGAVGSLAVIGIGGLIGYGINESKVWLLKLIISLGIPKKLKSGTFLFW